MVNEMEQIESIAPSPETQENIREQIMQTAQQIYDSFGTFNGPLNTAETAKAIRTAIRDFIEAKATVSANVEADGGSYENSKSFNTYYDAKEKKVSVNPDHSEETARYICTEINRISKETCGWRVVAGFRHGKGNYEEGGPSEMRNPNVESDFQVEVMVRNKPPEPKVSGVHEKPEFSQTKNLETEPSGISQARIIRYFLGENDIFNKQDVQTENSQERGQILAMIKNGEISDKDFKKLLMEIPQGPLPIWEKFLIRKAELGNAGIFDNAEGTKTKTRQAGILLKAVNGSFMENGKDLREETAENADNIENLLSLFIKKFPTPLDFEETSIRLIDDIQKANPNRPDLTEINKHVVSDMVPNIYGARYTYYKHLQALTQEAGVK